MKIKLPKLNCKYGAPMGRRSTPLTGKCRLQKVPLDSGGYDSGGAYWGFGQTLWVAQDENGNQCFVRANSREQAKRELAAMYWWKSHKSLTFYR